MNFTRRKFLKTCGAVTLAPFPALGAQEEGVWVNDAQSLLNPTRVRRIARPDSLTALSALVKNAARDGEALCIAGGRHAMGAQQFATDAVLIDTSALTSVSGFDAGEGLVEVGSGIQWPELLRQLEKLQTGHEKLWAIAQKPTGTDQLTIGGALAANVHGRGLRMRPVISNVEAFTLIDASGEIRRCSRAENAELFRIAIGGYGLFGLVASVQLRLVPRQKVRRDVKLLMIEELMPGFEERIAAGYLYGDFQFAIDEKSGDFLRRGVLSCYVPVDPATPLDPASKALSDAAWRELLYLAHMDKSEGFRRYSDYYLSTDGQIYWSDSQQLSTYLRDYHSALDVRLGTARATEIITELYVPRAALAEFMAEAREDFRRHGVDVIYGTIRLIERDTESFLAWARESYACVIFNLHAVHAPEPLRDAAAAFRRLIDMAIRRGGSYYLTYHKYASREQVLACYPQFPEFLREKLKHDPEERFASDWYRHYKAAFAG